MLLAPLDWVVVLGYVAFALFVGMRLARRAGRDVDQYFLSGRGLPWWLAGTSMVATTFAADTPLVVTGWVRDFGIFENWLWWCYAVGGVLTVFLFARWWRRGGVMTTAELAELRYGGRDAGVLRGFLGVYHTGVSNALILCWVLLAAGKILDVLFGIQEESAVVAAALVALSYCLLAGFWGVVTTDLVQFVMAMVGAIALAVIAWGAVGGTEGFLAFTETASLQPDLLALWPASGEGGPFDLAFWTVPLTAAALSLGVGWWAVDSVDGGGLVVQRIAASRDERHGLLGALWYNVAHYALRPWPWILVALASLVVLPTREVTAPVAGEVVAVADDGHSLSIQPDGDAAPIRVDLLEGGEEDWVPRPSVSVGATVESGEVVARTDSERAYPAMMARYLPVGLLGLVVASLFAAFMSTIDTHVNLAASYFVNDVYRRFLRKDASERHYVAAARWASAGVLALGCLLAVQAESIRDIFSFFLTFLAGVGPIYVLRWLWWRVRASTEITAMVASSIATITLTQTEANIDWALGPLSPGGDLTHQGRLLLVVTVSSICALASLLIARTPDPAKLVPFYRSVRPLGAWGPVRALCSDVVVPRDGMAAIVGIVGALALIYGTLFGLGGVFLGGDAFVAFVVAAVGGSLVVGAVRTLFRES